MILPFYFAVTFIRKRFIEFICNFSDTNEFVTKIFTLIADVSER